MRAIALFLFFLGSLTLVNGQIVTNINQHDSKGKKDGKWMSYYNKQWKVVEDSSKAYYYFYTYYNHGARMHTIARWGTKGGRLVDSLAGTDHMGKIELLDGKYTWFDKNGKLFAILCFDKGEPTLWKQFYPSGKLHLLFDYSKKCDGKPLSYFLNIYDKKGGLETALPISLRENGKWPIK